MNVHIYNVAKRIATPIRGTDEVHNSNVVKSGDAVGNSTHRVGAKLNCLWRANVKTCKTKVRKLTLLSVHVVLIVAIMSINVCYLLRDKTKTCKKYDRKSIKILKTLGGGKSGGAHFVKKG